MKFQVLGKTDVQYVSNAKTKKVVGSKSTILIANEQTKELEIIEIWGGKEHEMIGKKLKKNKGVNLTSLSSRKLNSKYSFCKKGSLDRMHQRKVKQYINKKEIYPNFEQCDINQNLEFNINGIDSLQDLKATIGHNGSKRVTTILQRITPFKVSREYARFGKRMFMKYCTVVVDEKQYSLKVFSITNDNEDLLCENTSNYVLLGDVFFKKNKGQLELQSYGLAIPFSNEDIIAEIYGNFLPKIINVENIDTSEIIDICSRDIIKVSALKAYAKENKKSSIFAGEGSFFVTTFDTQKIVYGTVKGYWCFMFVEGFYEEEKVRFRIKEQEILKMLDVRKEDFDTKEIYEKSLEDLIERKIEKKWTLKIAAIYSEESSDVELEGREIKFEEA